MTIYPYIKLIQHIYNQGTCTSRDHAILSTKGQYIMTLDPDDKFLNNSIEISYSHAIKSNADILEFEAQVNYYGRREYKIGTCMNETLNVTVLLNRFQRYKYFGTNWNLWKRIVKRSIYVKSVNLFHPFVKNKRICNGEDILHCGVIYIFIKNYFCGHFTAYYYYFGAKGSAWASGYDAKWQSNTQIALSKALSRYFYSNRNNLTACSLQDFLKNGGNFNLYNKTKNVDKTPKKNCSINIAGFSSSLNSVDGYCLIERI